MRRIAALAAVLLTAGGVALATVSPASASTYPRRLSALSWAESQVGKPYVWGGTGPYGYDCSGLVMAAYAHAGIALPRTTYEMLGSWRLWRVWHPVRGDLAFYGSGHVELVQMPRYHRTFGAHDSGSRIGSIKWGPYWAPTMFFRVRGAG